MKRLVFILIIICVICYFQYNHINNINNSFEILQYENPQKNIVENMLQDKLITIFTNVKFDNWDITLQQYNLQKDIIDKKISDNLYYYNIPLTIEANHQVLFESQHDTNLIRKQDKYRHLFYILKGTKRFFIFTAEQDKYLYLENNISPINLWDQNTIKYPLIEKAKYIEVICREKTLISIPYKFYYTTICDEDTITIDFHSESIFSKTLKK